MGHRGVPWRHRRESSEHTHSPKRGTFDYVSEHGLWLEKGPVGLGSDMVDLCPIASRVSRAMLLRLCVHVFIFIVTPAEIPRMRLTVTPHRSASLTP